MSTIMRASIFYCSMNRVCSTNWSPSNQSQPVSIIIHYCLLQNQLGSTYDFKIRRLLLCHVTVLKILQHFQVFVVLIMLNLLISLMTTTFARIQTNADMEWKFTRASTWINYFDVSLSSVNQGSNLNKKINLYFQDHQAIPVPFNVIPSFHSIKSLIACCKRQILESLEGAKNLFFPLRIEQQNSS